MFQGTGHVLVEIKVWAPWVVYLNEMKWKTEGIPISFFISSTEKYIKTICKA
jgi:hypothetical protein